MPSPDPAHVLSTGTVLNERYRVDEVLGAGAFGITYRATDTRLSSTVVVKELYPESYRMGRRGTAVTIPTAKEGQHQHLVGRVLKQGRLLRTLDHPHLMSVYGAFEAHDTAYLVVEHLEGTSLREQLDERGTLPGTEMWQLIEEVGDGLSALHEEGALHLDVKPANIVKASGKYVVIDYGAGRMDSEEESVRLSTGGFTPEYAAVEQTDDAMEKGPYTDIYALGVTAYESATGKRPPKSVARLMKREDSLTWPDGIDDALQARLEKALQVRPKDRPASVEAWLAEPATEEMPPAEEGASERGEDHPEHAGVRGADWQFREWLSASRIATAMLPVLALGMVVVGLEWGGVIDLGERMYEEPDNSNPPVEEDTSRAPVSENREGSVKQEGQSEAKRRDRDRVTEEQSPTTSTSKNQGGSKTQGKQSEAAPENNRATDGGSPPARALERRGDSLREQGRLGAALESYDRAVEEDPSYAKAWYSRGLVLRRQDRWEEAAKSFGRALEVDPSYAKAWTNRSHALIQQGQWKEALKSANRAIEENPSDAWAWNNRGVILEEQGRLEEALESYDRAVEEDPSNAKAWHNRGDVLKEQGRLEEALESYERATEEDPSYAKAWYNRGFVLQEQGRLREALKSYNRAVEEDSSLARPWRSRGLVLKEQGRLEEALESYDRAVEEDPSYAKAWNSRGLVLKEQGRLEEALESYDRAVEEDPSNAQAWANRGIALHRHGDEAGAAESWDRACELDSEYCGPYPWEKD